MSAPIITVYRNGDNHFVGKKVVINKQIRNLDGFLDKVTRDVRMKVAVRSIRTPNHGTKVASLDKLLPGGVYVAVGPEKFKTITYTNIQGYSLPRAKTVDLPTVRPVFHSRIHASARYGKQAESEALQNRIITVYRNDDDKYPGFKLLLDKRILDSMDNILGKITEKINLRTGAVQKLYDLDGKEVLTPTQIKSGTCYVAVGHGKRFVKKDYTGIVPLHLTPRKPKLDLLSPRPARKPKKNVKSPEKSKNQDAWKKHQEQKKNKEGAKKKPSPKKETKEDQKIVDEPQDEFNEDLSNRLDNLEDELEYDAESNRKPAVPVSPEKVFDRALRSTKTNSVNSQMQDGADESRKPSGKELSIAPEKHEEIEEKQATPTPVRSNSIDDDNVEDVNSARKSITPTQPIKDASPSPVESPAPIKDASPSPVVSPTPDDIGNSSARAHKAAANEMTDELMQNSEKNVEKLLSDDEEDAPAPAEDEDTNVVDEEPEVYKGGIEDSSEAQEDVIDDTVDNVPGDTADTDDKAPDDTVFKASGEQAEDGEAIKDSSDTTLEKTIDQQPEEDIEEEIPEEDATKNPEVDNKEG